MLKHPDTFLPVTTDSGFEALVSSGFNGDFRLKDLSNGDLYVNFVAMGQSFFRIAQSDVVHGTSAIELVEDKAKIKNLSRAKYKYVDLYLQS
jgi:hypothetical protein